MNSASKIFGVGDVFFEIKIPQDIIHPLLVGRNSPLARSFQKFTFQKVKADVVFSFEEKTPIRHSNEEAEKINRFLRKPGIQYCDHSGRRFPHWGWPGLFDTLKKVETKRLELYIEAFGTHIVLYDFRQHTLAVYFNKNFKKYLIKARLMGGLMAPFMPLFSAVLTHGAGVVRGSKAAVFLAQDEGGKTTVCLQAPPDSILSDDQIVIRKRGSHYFAYGTPWGVHTNNSGGHTMGAFFYLKKSDHFALQPMKKSQLMEYLWNENYGNYVPLPKRLRCDAFELLWKICQAIPAYEMHFTKDHINWQAIDQTLGL